MKTIAAVIDAMPPKTYASRAGFRSAVFRACVRLTGCEPIATRQDAAGNCLVCGESGRCVGLHLFSEFPTSLRA